MSVVHDLIIDPLASPVDGEQHLATWYTQGHSDGLGDRLLMFDNTSAPSWEILRFRPALAQDLRFEQALRQRMERLASFRHPAFPLVRPLSGLGHQDGLAVASTFAPGLSLSEAMKRPRSVGFAVRLVRQLVPAIAALQQHGPAMFHGLLDADRVVVTADGRLTIREHMIGSALASLELSSATLWSDFHIIAAPPAVLDSRSDVIQLGLLVLSLMAGHRVTPDEYPGKVEGLLDEIGQRTARHALVSFQSLRYWLERALQLDVYMFDSALDANEALEEIRDDTERRDDFRTSAGGTLHDAPAGAAVEDASGHDSGARANGPPRPQWIQSAHFEDGGTSSGMAAAFSDVGAGVEEEAVPAQTSTRPVKRRLGRVALWAAAAVAAVALAEAAFIGQLLYARAATPPPVPSPALTRPTPAPFLPASPIAPVDSIAEASQAESKLSSKSGSAAVPVGSIGSHRSGAIRLSAPFEVHVLENERVLGSSTDGPIIAPAGEHEFELINSSIGFRTRRVIDVKAGEITSLTVTVPNGTLNINAVPWAAVWIDGNSFGDTPLGNLSISAGEHEIVFRHPQLGERRERTLVRAGAATRVTINLER